LITLKEAKVRDRLKVIIGGNAATEEVLRESGADAFTTSAEDGIRHASIKQAEVDFDTAKFMLVSCSAFVNYLIAQSAKAGMKLE